MKLYSTNNPGSFVSFKEAVLKSLPKDNGLFMPEKVEKLPISFINDLKNHSFPELSFIVSKHLLKDCIPVKILESIISKSISFPAPVIKLKDNFHLLELFHGPSLAFKDFGARFMAQTMSYFNRNENKELIILVATSGDTGGAVAAGFYDVPGIKVVVLYPSGKVSDLQERQLTTLGKNISALKVNGTFDDCQALVKKAFLDSDLNNKLRLSSANSINIARLIPQSFYYFEAFKQIDSSRPIVFSVPSGNYGNITAGLMAKRMGLPIQHFLAASNINDIVPKYLQTGTYSPRPSAQTISNAMDVGNPSNFTRIQALYGSTWNHIKQDISGFSFDDKATKEGIREVWDKFNYLIDPHGAIGYLALKEYLQNNPEALGIVLETAHPAKFIDVIEPILKKDIEIPTRLASLSSKEKVYTSMEFEFGSFKEWLFQNF